MRLDPKKLRDGNWWRIGLVDPPGRRSLWVRFTFDDGSTEINCAGGHLNPVGPGDPGDVLTRVELRAGREGDDSLFVLERAMIDGRRFADFVDCLLRAVGTAADAEEGSFRMLAEWFEDKAAWSKATFGPGDRLKGVLAHIRKELIEIERKPDDLEEWVDIVLLAMDGAWRSASARGADFVRVLLDKQVKNRSEREWPDWRLMSADEPIEHVREPPVKGAQRDE